MARNYGVRFEVIRRLGGARHLEGMSGEAKDLLIGMTKRAGRISRDRVREVSRVLQREFKQRRRGELRRERFDRKLAEMCEEIQLRMDGIVEPLIEWRPVLPKKKPVDSETLSVNRMLDLVRRIG